MFGIGILRGLSTTLKRTVTTFVDDIGQASRYINSIDTPAGKILQQPPEIQGLFTIQYPEEKRQLPENFRFIPMLVYEADTGKQRCTACGICSKVCPSQCIWIVRDQTKEGKPIPRPKEFYIDASICMSCGFCAEFCPFDSIKMNHDYELAVYDRYPGLILDLEELSVPTTYYAALYPKAWAAEEEARRLKEERKRARAKKAAAAKAKKAAATKQPAPKKATGEG
ncbi:MAG TPA: 4Fe-4S dicluster domain-containing protein, partial [Anaerolineae bacterium]|nr:4Fe-4S dicluster domain-containing protein [Anaerolineae bacterium]